MKRSQAKTARVGPWPRGYQNQLDAARTPPDALLEAANVDISDTGAVNPRDGYQLMIGDAHSLFEHDGISYAIISSRVCILEDTGARVLDPMPIDGKVRWTVLNNNPVFVNRNILAQVLPTGVQIIPIPRPVPSGVPEADGVTRAYSLIRNADGVEGPLSHMTTDDDAAHPEGSADFSIRRYKVKSVAYRDEVDSNLPPERGSQLYSEEGDLPPATQGTEPMPGGEFVTYWRGRLIVARGKTLYVSRALAYHIYDVDAGLYPFEGRIQFIESVETGVFVGVKGVGVYFLRGESPDSWARILSSTKPVQYGASLTMPTPEVELGQNKPEWVAAWFTDCGFAIGLPSGEVLYPQSDLLGGLPLGEGSMQYADGRLTVLSN